METDTRKLLILRAGDGDRTRDVQLGKMGVDRIQRKLGFRYLPSHQNILHFLPRFECRGMGCMHFIHYQWLHHGLLN
jgi:hypothetical protein